MSLYPEIFRSVELIWILWTLSFIACLPRQGWTISRVHLPVRAQCTHARRPSTRNPVSSNPATSLATICPPDKKLLHGMRDAILVPAAEIPG